MQCCSCGGGYPLYTTINDEDDDYSESNDNDIEQNITLTGRKFRVYIPPESIVGDFALNSSYSGDLGGSTFDFMHSFAHSTGIGLYETELSETALDISNGYTIDLYNACQ